MTPYIEAKKAEVRKKLEDFLSVHERWQGSSRTISTDLEPFLGEIVDTLLDEIESRVVPEKQERGDNTGSFALMCQGWNDCREEATRLFQHLRTGVETEVC